MRTGIYPGSFDPVTLGHFDIIERSSKIFDRLIVGVLQNSSKSPLFSTEERVNMLRKVTEGLDNVEIMSFNGLLVDFVRANEASVVVRGLRAITDFEYEFQMTALNYQLSQELETLFIMSPPQYMYLSSSIVREIASLGGDVARFVPPCVAEALAAKFASVR